MKEILQKLTYGKFNKKTFNKYKNQINQNNYKRLIVLCLIELFFNLLAYITVTIKTTTILANGSVAYLMSVLISISFYILAKSLIKEKKSYMTVFFYIYIIVSLVVYSMLGITYNIHYNATIICMMYIIYAIMLVDKPYRFSTILFAFTILTSLHTLSLKEYNIAIIDCLNFLVACAAGIAVSYYVFNERIEKLVNEEFIKRERDTDYLTKLRNRASSEVQINEYLKVNKNININAMFVIDLDNFKKVNDTLGHAAGDKLLVSVSKILKHNFRNTDYISRIGGDEFAIFLPSIKSKKMLEQKAHNIIKEILKIKTGNVKIGASIGIAYSKPSMDYNKLFANADNAMYDAKESGKNCYKIYNE